METVAKCPHCGLFILIAEVNCGIFRHGVNKQTGKQLPPHATLEECQRDEVYGCAKPFRMLTDGTLVVCGYI